jgi:hypothetical protein
MSCNKNSEKRGQMGAAENANEQRANALEGWDEHDDDGNDREASNLKGVRMRSQQPQESETPFCFRDACEASLRIFSTKNDFPKSCQIHPKVYLQVKICYNIGCEWAFPGRNCVQGHIIAFEGTGTSRRGQTPTVAIYDPDKPSVTHHIIYSCTPSTSMWLLQTMVTLNRDSFKKKKKTWNANLQA